MSQADVDAALGRIAYVDSLDGLKGADIVIEAIVEDIGAKRELFGKLAGMFTGGQILASNTSSISITELAVAAGKVGGENAAGRVIGMHFFNPVPVMKLVEVIKGLQTTAETTERVIALAKAMGKTPIPANDRAGFVSNRVLMPMINEAFYAWMEGSGARAHRRDHETRVQLPDGAAAAGGLHRPGHVRAHHGRAGRGAEQRPLPRVPAAEATGDGGPAGGQDGAGVYEYPQK